MSLITLTTDFGYADWYVGVTKGVILSLAPEATIVDICHDIPGGNIRAAAFGLAAAYRYFPEGTIHVAVVDPGVGTNRNAIVVQTARYFFVAPDNGVLSTALEKETVKAIYKLENESFFLTPVSCTFHARDIFAPVAAHLSKNPACLEDLGSKLADYHKFEKHTFKKEGDMLRGSVAYIDRFGNAITNISNDEVGLDYRMVSCTKAAFPLRSCYQAMPVGHGVAVRGSSGFVEIAVNGSSAAERYNLVVGSPVTVRQYSDGPGDSPSQVPPAAL